MHYTSPLSLVSGVAGVSDRQEGLGSRSDPLQPLSLCVTGWAGGTKAREAASLWL